MINSGDRYSYRAEKGYILIYKEKARVCLSLHVMWHGGEPRV